VSPGDRPAGSAGGAAQVVPVSENTPPDLMQHTSHVCAVFFMQSSYASKSHEGSSAFAMAALPTARPIANVAAARLFPERVRIVANEIISSLSVVEVMSVPIVVSASSSRHCQDPQQRGRYSEPRLGAAKGSRWSCSGACACWLWRPTTSPTHSGAVLLSRCCQEARNGLCNPQRTREAIERQVARPADTARYFRLCARKTSSGTIPNTTVGHGQTPSPKLLEAALSDWLNRNSS
jgi:hypothetical protein